MIFIQPITIIKIRIFEAIKLRVLDRWAYIKYKDNKFISYMSRIFEIQLI